MTRVLIVEDHEMLSDTLSAALEAEGYDVLVPPSLQTEAVVELAREAEPKVVLLDLRLSDDRSATEMIEPLRDAGASVLMVTGETEKVALAECVEAGAVGIVQKSAPLHELIEAVHDVVQDRPHMPKWERTELLRLLREHRRTAEERLAPFERLSPREQEVLAAVMDGLSAEAIAERDFISLSTTRTHIRSILQKLAVNSQIAAVAMARAAGWDPSAGSR